MKLLGPNKELYWQNIGICSNQIASRFSIDGNDGDRSSLIDWYFFGILPVPKSPALITTVYRLCKRKQSCVSSTVVLGKKNRVAPVPTL
jgi:hypothetical protein